MWSRVRERGVRGGFVGVRGVSRERMSSSVVRMRSSLCVFDATRKVKEGEEEGKALCFLPASSPAAARGNVVGLAMGLLTFSRVFSPTRPVEAMHATGHRVIFNECEKDVWAVLV